MGSGNPASDFNQTGLITASMLAASATFTSSVTAVKTSAYSANIGELVQGDPTLGTFTVTLPAISASNKGQAIIVKNAGTSTSGITVGKTGGNTIDGGTSTSIATAHGCVGFVSDGTSNWDIIDGTAAAFAATLALTTSGNGASLVGIYDVAALLTATTVETALAELVKYVPLNLADPGTGQAIPVTRSAYVGMTCAGTETGTLADPTFLGQRLILNLDTATSGTRTVTAASAINQTGNTKMAFAQARDCIVLEAIKVGGALKWTVSANDGVALST